MAQAQVDTHLSTGLPGLDAALKGLIPGDNIVFHVRTVEDYLPFVPPYYQNALRLGYPVIYFRFAKHEPLVPDLPGVRRCELNPQAGFELFLDGVHKAIQKTGRGGFYIFDCLSDLAADWYSDQMLANFFRLTCPYLYDVNAIAYFSILRQEHALHTTSMIADTAQVLIDVYNHKGQTYVHPWKVKARYSPTMHMLHRWKGDEFQPITESATISEILTHVHWMRQETPGEPVGLWNRTFLMAQQAWSRIQTRRRTPRQVEALFHRVLRMAISRDDRVLKLAEKYFTLGDVLDVARRMVGTGLIGGKSVGMLLARAILRQADARWANVLESHDSFYIGSDVFYTFMVQNGLWWTREHQKNPQAFLDGAEFARQRMLTGTFPDYIQREFEDMLDYFGQSPIIVRSSSLLEDNFGNAFAGKYESIFCANQGPRARRLDDFINAVRAIYASSMSRDALSYRAQRGLLDRDEQMALLVQRVSGAQYGRDLHYPQMAGVGFSFNPYVWSSEIDPKSGVVRLVVGMGTRAVDRSDDDYTRLVALNAPHRRPEADIDAIRKYSQRIVDVLELSANQLVSMSFNDVLARSPQLPVEMFASQESSLGDSKSATQWTITFDKLFNQTNFIANMREILATLHHAYDYAVDVEFATNFLPDGSYRINVLQCRPLQVKEGGPVGQAPTNLPAQDVLLRAHGAVLGRSRQANIDRIICVVPSVFGDLPVADRYAIARLIGKLTHLDATPPATLLIGPGRWGTTTPSLGVPVQFADIHTASVICEVVAMGKDLVPDVSLGTHFFSELVELDMLYFALFPQKPDNALNMELLMKAPNRLAELLPGEARWADAVRVVDAAGLPGGGPLKLHADVLTQHAVCYVQP